MVFVLQLVEGGNEVSSVVDWMVFVVQLVEDGNEVSKVEDWMILWFSW